MILKNTRDAAASAASATESMARESLLRMTWRKWSFVRVFEVVLRLLRPILPSPQKESLEPPASIVVLEFWNLGDLAILVPFLNNLRRAFPRARISLLINEAFKSFLDGHGIVDELIPVKAPWAQRFHRWHKYSPFSFDWISLARNLLTLRQRRFDWAISGRMDVRDNLILWLIGARRRIGYGFAGGGAFLTDRVVPDLSLLHRADTWLHLLEAVNVRVDRKLGHLQLRPSEAASARSYLVNGGIPSDAFLIGIHPGARIATRRWGDDRFAEVARRLLQETDAHILWFSEPGTLSRGPALERCHTVSESFRPFLSLLSRCHILICNDSAPMHLANLLCVPVVAVFGPQRPEWYGPRGPQDRVVIRPEFSCRPCWDYCVFDQPYCLRAISVDEVHDAIRTQMNHILESENVGVSSAPTVELVSHV